MGDQQYRNFIKIVTVGRYR